MNGPWLQHLQVHSATTPPDALERFGTCDAGKPERQCCCSQSCTSDLFGIPDIRSRLQKRSPEISLQHALSISVLGAAASKAKRTSAAGDLSLLLSPHSGPQASNGSAQYHASCRRARKTLPRKEPVVRATHPEGLRSAVELGKATGAERPEDCSLSARGLRQVVRRVITLAHIRATCLASSSEVPAVAAVTNGRAELAAGRGTTAVRTQHAQPPGMRRAPAKAYGAEVCTRRLSNDGDGASAARLSRRAPMTRRCQLALNGLNALSSATEVPAAAAALQRHQAVVN